MTQHGKEKGAGSQPFSHRQAVLWVDALIISLRKRQKVWYPIFTPYKMSSQPLSPTKVKINRRKGDHK
jgi:hypothetical protein